VEIWDIVNGVSLRVIDLGHTMFTLALHSVNNVLAVGGSDQTIKLYDVRSWDIVQTKRYNVSIYSIHLTQDMQYLTVGGMGGCFVEKLY